MSEKLHNLIQTISLKKIMIFCDLVELPHTAARTQEEAWAVQYNLDQRRPEYKWHVEDGPKDWKTGKPICYLIKATKK